MSSPTLGRIMKHLINSEVPDTKYIDFPFNVESFCRENDEEIEALRAQLSEVVRLSDLFESKLLKTEEQLAELLKASENHQEDWNKLVALDQAYIIQTSRLAEAEAVIKDASFLLNLYTDKGTLKAKVTAAARDYLAKWSKA